MNDCAFCGVSADGPNDALDAVKIGGRYRGLCFSCAGVYRRALVFYPSILACLSDTAFRLKGEWLDTDGDGWLVLARKVATRSFVADCECVNCRRLRQIQAGGFATQSGYD